MNNSLDDSLTVGVIGAGLMGSGIAQTALQHGHRAVLLDADLESLARGRHNVLRKIESQAAKGRVSADLAASADSRLEASSDLSAFVDCDVVIEAVVENLQVKNEIFTELDALVPEHVVLASNTSALPISAIAAGLKHPERVIGMHFFSPVPATALCEIVKGIHTSEPTTARAAQVAEQLGKQTIVVARDDAGFVTSRLMTVLSHEAVRIVEQGLASAKDVDKACELAFGHRMGPLATIDLTGLDIALRAGDGIYRETADAAYAPPQLLRRMVSAGQLGRKTGQGFYTYTKEAQ